MDHPLILIRHAKSAPDPDTKAGQWALSDHGKQQAVALASILSEYDISRIFSSTEPKAINTAQLAAEGLNISTDIVEDVHEHDRSNSPYFETQAEFESAVLNLFQSPDELVYGTETASQAEQRFRHAVQRLCRQHPEETLAIVSHGTVIALFVSAFNQMDAIEFWQQLAFTSCVVLSRPDFKLLEIKHPPHIGG